MKKALITGITGQDGSYLAELLLEKGYEVHGIIRRSSTFSTERIEHLYQGPREPDARLKLHYGDLSDSGSLRDVLERCAPDELYHLGAQSHVKVSFDQPLYTCDVTGLGTTRLLEAIKEYGERTCNPPRYYQASSSEMFGSTPPPQSIDSRFQPRSPYACAKVFGFHQAVLYREAYNLYAVNGVLFNHESPRRGETFVTRKITRAVGRIKVGLQRELYLGNIAACRDWGHAKDFVRAMWMMLQADEPSDYVVATGEMHSVNEFAEAAFAHVGLDWDDFVRVDERYLRPADVEALQGDATRTTQAIGWEPEISFEELVAEMVEHDLELARREKLIQDHG